MARILIVDDEMDIRKILKEYFMVKGYDVQTAADGPSALNLVKSFRPNIVFLDVIMPEMNGFDALREIKKIDPAIGVVMITGISDEGSMKIAFDLGADDFIIKPFNFNYIDTAVVVKISDLLSRAEEKARISYQKLQRTLEGIVKVVARIVETRDPYTSGHQERVSKLARAMAGEMGLAPDQMNAIGTAAIIQNLGKIYVPAEILTKTPA